MQFRYIPSAIEAISPPIDLEMAINEATGLPGPYDYSVLVNRLTGEMQFKYGDKLLTHAEAAAHNQPRIEATRRAAHDVLEALRSGALPAYVAHADDKRVWQIPRLYFLRREPHQLANEPLVPWDPASGEDASMIGQPIMLSRRDYKEWLVTYLERRRDSDDAVPADDLPDGGQPPSPPVQSMTTDAVTEIVRRCVADNLGAEPTRQAIAAAFPGRRISRDRVRQLHGDAWKERHGSAPSRGANPLPSVRD